MGEIINLNRARKTRALAQDKARAAANRASNGMTKTQRKIAEIENARARSLLDGTKLDD